MESSFPMAALLTVTAYYDLFAVALTTMLVFRSGVNSPRQFDVLQERVG
jgi:hypothetical protein